MSNNPLNDSSITIHKARELSFDHITIVGPKNRRATSKFLPIRYQTKQLIINTPRLQSRYNISENDWGKHTLSLYLKPVQGKSFHKFLTKFDSWIINKAINNSIAWFGMELPPDIIVSNYTPTVKTSDRYGDFFRVNIPVKKSDGSYNLAFFDKNNQIILKDDLNLESTIIVSVIYAKFIWINDKNKFGVTWELCQLKINRPKKEEKKTTTQSSDKDNNTVRGFAFLKDDDE